MWHVRGVRVDNRVHTSVEPNVEDQVQQKIKVKGVAMQRDTISNNKIKGNGVTFWKHVESSSMSSSTSGS